jgi:hypothetical protein
VLNKTLANAHAPTLTRAALAAFNRVRWMLFPFASLLLDALIPHGADKHLPVLALSFNTDFHEADNRHN